MNPTPCQDNCPGCSIIPWHCWLPGSSGFLNVVRRSPSCCTTPSPASKSFLWALLQLPWPWDVPQCPLPAWARHLQGFPTLQEPPCTRGCSCSWQLEVPQPELQPGAAPRASHSLCWAATPNRHQALHLLLAQRGCSPAGHSGKLRVPLERPLSPSRQGRQEQDDAQKGRGHCGWGQQGSCLCWVPHTGSSQEQEMCAPQRHPGQPRDTCPGARETLEQLQAQRNIISA